MLDEQTLSTVVGELVGSASVLGHELNAETAALIAADLLGAGFPLADIRSAMRRVRSEFSGRTRRRRNGFSPRQGVAAGPGADSSGAVAARGAIRRKFRRGRERARLLKE